MNIHMRQTKGLWTYVMMVLRWGLMAVVQRVPSQQATDRREGEGSQGSTPARGGAGRHSRAWRWVACWDFKMPSFRSKAERSFEPPKRDFL